ncbi:MAG: immunoglobulin domain-containing protein [Opitutaceae bacterium]
MNLRRLFPSLLIFLPAVVSAQTATAPTITTQPAGVTAIVGGNATFSVVAAGTAPLAYQWLKGDTSLPAGTAASLTLTNLTAGDAGAYKVRVTNTAGSVTSSSANLTVNAAPVAGTKPAITTQPVSKSVATGASHTFSAAATGTAPLTYAWYKEGRLVSSGSNADLVFASVAPSDGGTYRLVVSNAAGSAVSESASLTVTAASGGGSGSGSGGGPGGGSSPGSGSTPAATAPAITTQPAATTASSGTKVTFSVVATGTAPLRYRWYKDGREIERAESATYELSSARVDNAGLYSVRVSNSAGSITSAPAALTVNGAATITTPPTTQVVNSGTDATFTVAATGTDLTYAWKFNGRTVRGATSATLKVTNPGVLAEGIYTVTVSTRGSSAAAASAARLSVTTDARLVNIATRGQVGEGDDVLISGFVTRGAQEKKILVRAIGPTLNTAFGVTGALAAPRLTLSSTGRGGGVLKTNAGWGGAADLAAVFPQVGAFPLADNALDAAILSSLGAGTYTGAVSAPAGVRGVALLEVYDADAGSPAAEIVNLSTRALVGAEAAGTLIAGFAIRGTTSDTVLVRGVGPSLGRLFGLSRAIGATQVTVYDGRGQRVAGNSVWTRNDDDDDDDDDRDKDRDDDDKSSDIEAASDRSGAWRLPRGTSDSALLLTLAPGVYTVHVTGVRGASGTGLVEVFEVR